MCGTVRESTDIEEGVIDRITVRELSSFFNVGASAAEFIVQTLSQKKYKGRKVRVEEAEARDRERSSGGGGDRSGGGGRSRSNGSSSRPSGGGFSRRGGDDEKPRYGRGDGSQKFNKRY